MTADPQVGQQYVAAEIIDSNVHMSQTYRFCAEAELTNNRYGQDNSKKKKDTDRIERIRGHSDFEKRDR